MSHTLRSIAIGATVGVLAAAGVTVAAAQIPAADGTVTACMVKPGGTIRLIDAEAGATCKKGEQLVSWNEAGQPGISGYERVSEATDHTIESASTTIISDGILCPEGKVVLSGGATVDQLGIEAYNSAPITTTNNGVLNQGWRADFVRIDGVNFGAGREFTTRMYAICAYALP